MNTPSVKTPECEQKEALTQEETDELASNLHLQTHDWSNTLTLGVCV